MLPRRMYRPARLVPFGLGAGFLLWLLFHLSGPPFHLLQPDGPVGPPSRPFRTSTTNKWPARADAVRQAYLHAYNGYKLYAKGSDELLPLTEHAVNNLNGWGVTLVDGLDTMWIMGLHNEFYDALAEVSNMTFHLEKGTFAPFFETVIRYLGGLLSAYALSGEPALLARADDLGSKLLPALHTQTGLPRYAVNTDTGMTRNGWSRGVVLWAEALSCQVEYKYLAHLTGRREYYDDVEKIMDLMRNANVTDGMFPTKWSLTKGTPANAQFSVGAFADSAHEYLLKQWLLTSKSETKALDLYLLASNAIIDNLLYLTPKRHLLYVTDLQRSKPSHAFEHLACFLPGLLALGAHTLPPAALPPHQRDLHMWAARGLAETCWLTYADHETGLGPDEVVMDQWRWSEEVPYAGRWVEHVRAWEAGGRRGGAPPGVEEKAPRLDRKTRDYRTRRPGYYLRPETVESFYVLWRLTGDKVWRERGWAVFQAIEREAKTDVGYASLISVETSPARKKDEMPSFFMAETLKYLYLLFTDDDVLPLDRWVFNTEAHPLPVFEWTAREKAAYDIPA